MSEHLKIHVSGIKCDACDYKNEEVNVEDYEKWLNKPCPNCGANLLTEEDFNNVKMLMELANFVNTNFPVDSNDEIVSTEVKMDGTGKMDFKIKEN